MNPRTINSLFALLALAGVGVGVYSWMSTQPVNTPSSISTHTTTPPTPSNTPTPTISPLATTSPVNQNRMQFSEIQNLSIANRTETLELGGNLVSIATKYGVTISQLAKVNHLVNPDKLFAGQTIIVPDGVTETDYTVLYTLNENRLTSEKKRVASGSKSIYQDPITATLADTKSLFGIAADSPFSTNASESGTSVTLTTSNDSWFISVGLEKLTDGFWIIKRVIAKNKTKTETAATPKVEL